MTSFEEKYFAILKDYFAEPYRIAAKEKFDTDKYLPTLSHIYDSVTASSMTHSLYKELASLDWSSQRDSIRKIAGLRAAYVGSGFSYLENVSSTSDFLRKTCLYADTIILTEGIFRSLSSRLALAKDEEIYIPPCLFFGMIKSAIDFLTIENLFTSDSNPHICTLAPGLEHSMMEKRNGVLSQLRKEELLTFASDLFDRRFGSMKELRKFLDTMKNIEQFEAHTRKPEMLATPDGQPMSHEDLEGIRDNFEASVGPYYYSGSLYRHFLRVYTYGLAENLLEYADYRPILATDLSGIWTRLIWLIKKDNEKILAIQKRKQFTKEELIVSALQQKDLRWLGNVPLNKLEQLRAKGELEELRLLIGTNVQNIEDASDAEFAEVAKLVKYNIETALKKHDAQIKSLNEEYRRRYKIDIASIAVSGAIGITCAVYPPMAFISGIVGAPSIYKMLEDYVSKREKNQELRNKPVAMLFDAKRVCD